VFAVLIAQVHGLCPIILTEEHAGFLVKFAHDRYPMAQRQLGRVAPPEHFSRLLARQAVAALQNSRRVIFLMNRPARKHVEAAHETHFGRPTRQQNLKARFGVRPNEHNRRSVAGPNHQLSNNKS
jgi:hypothetical protein